MARYRCRNDIGWSEFSTRNYLLMAGIPTVPPKPTYISSDSTSITVQLYQSEWSNGSPITSYEVWTDQGDNLSEIDTKETLYDGSSMSYTLTGLTPGLVYKIAVKASNVEGTTGFGYYAAIGASELPDQVQNL